MIEGFLGKQVAIIQCSDKSLVGLRGVLALETMKTITVVSDNAKRTVPKVGTVFRLQENGKIVVGNEMYGRLEDRIAKGAKV